jgi:hypothetical protein
VGFHVCEYCQQEGRLKEPMEYGPFSSADVLLCLNPKRVWVFPHVGLLHYVTQHDYKPPQEFIDDVLLGSLLGWDNKEITPTKVGYLTGRFTKGPVPHYFASKLASLILITKAAGWPMFRQTRGYSPMKAVVDEAVVDMIRDSGRIK